MPVCACVSVRVSACVRVSGCVPLSDIRQLLTLGVCVPKTEEREGGRVGNEGGGWTE